MIGLNFQIRIIIENLIAGINKIITSKGKINNWLIKNYIEIIKIVRKYRQIKSIIKAIMNIKRIRIN